MLELLEGLLKELPKLHEESILMVLGKHASCKSKDSARKELYSLLEGKVTTIVQ